MKIKMLENTNCDLKRVKKGDVVDASSKDGNYLIATGAAEVYVEKPKAKKAPVNRKIEDRETR